MRKLIESLVRIRRRVLGFRRGPAHYRRRCVEPRPSQRYYACVTCNDTGKIIRGNDGQRITCPACRKLGAGIG